MYQLIVKKQGSLNLKMLFKFKQISLVPFVCLVVFIEVNFSRERNTIVLVVLSIENSVMYTKNHRERQLHRQKHTEVKGEQGKA